jgi:CRP-like cAMP-binding protein
MQPDARSKRWEDLAAHPLAELLACPPSTSHLLTASAQSMDFESGRVIFSQSSLCLGLYLVVSGQLVRRAERMEMRLTLGTARSGDLLELAAVLGDRLHTYTLVAQTAGSILLLPIDALYQSFQSHPPLQMRLLEELAREVSRAYHLCSLTSLSRTRRRGESPIREVRQG